MMTDDEAIAWLEGHVGGFWMLKMDGLWHIRITDQPYWQPTIVEAIQAARDAQEQSAGSSAGGSGARPAASRVTPLPRRALEGSRGVRRSSSQMAAFIVPGDGSTPVSEEK